MQFTFDFTSLKEFYRIILRLNRDAVVGKTADLPAFCGIKCGGRQWYGGSTFIRLRAATGGKAAKAWSLSGFWEIDNGGGALMKWRHYGFLAYQKSIVVALLLVSQIIDPVHLFPTKFTS